MIETTGSADRALKERTALCARRKKVLDEGDLAVLMEKTERDDG